MASETVELISTKEAAEILQVTRQGICKKQPTTSSYGKMIWDGRLKATKLGNATSPWRINKESVMTYLRQAS